VLAWEVTHIMGRCGLIANATHIVIESQVTLLLQVQRDLGGEYIFLHRSKFHNCLQNLGVMQTVLYFVKKRWRPYDNHTNDNTKTLYDLLLPTKCDSWMLLSSKLNPRTTEVQGGLCKGYPCSTTQGEAIIVVVSFELDLHRMTWNLGNSLFTKSAWGQAKFLGR